jgi:hypothetical protein
MFLKAGMLWHGNGFPQLAHQCLLYFWQYILSNVYGKWYKYVYKVSTPRAVIVLHYQNNSVSPLYAT